jgi:predicted nucleotidyltransferase
MKDKKTFLKELKDLLVAHFGEDINNVILFGSQVTGKTHEDSDFDVLIILNRDFDWDYQRRVTAVVYDLELKYDIFIDKKLISIDELHHSIKGKHPLYWDAIEQGIYA